MHRSVTQTNHRQHLINKISSGPLESTGESASGMVCAETFGSQSTQTIGDRDEWKRSRKLFEAVFGRLEDHNEWFDPKATR